MMAFVLILITSLLDNYSLDLLLYHVGYREFSSCIKSAILEHHNLNLNDNNGSINPSLEFLAYQFRILPATASRIFMKWLKQMDLRLQDLIIWPDRDALQKTMPMCFQASFGKKVAVIIDCFEIFIDRPSNLSARPSTWSNYKGMANIQAHWPSVQVLPPSILLTASKQ